MRRGWKGEFVEELDLARFGPGERHLALWLGRIGLIARGVVFSIIGVFLILAAWHHHAHASTGMDSALVALTRQHDGRALLAVVAFGLVVFGIYSILCARWTRVRTRARDSRAPSQPDTR